MCGIAGIFNFSDVDVQRIDIEKMTQLVQHRGPDGNGIYCNGKVALGHRRLSILDLSESASQPMFFGEKYIIVFNGEIYNYIEIRAELQKHGYTFKSSGDTEVILAAYDLWSYDCVSRFNGMWSFAIYDRSNNSLFCSRDRFGVKPFYYSLNNKKFIFGSEIRQLLGVGITPVVNNRILADYLILGLEEYDEHTFFKGILRLNPSHNLICDLNTGIIKIEKYYSAHIDSSVSELSLEESKELFLKELVRSVTYRLRSDVKVGTCLSGGLDSSTIAAIAADIYHKNSDKKFTALTAGSIDNINDETEYARMVVEKSNLDWETVIPSSEQFFKSIDEVIEAQEEPFGSPSIFMQYFVMQKSKDIGCPVLLDGQGGDETLLGYQRYYPSYLKSLKGIFRFSEFFNSSTNSGLSPFQMLKQYFYFTNSTVRIKRQLKRSGFMKNDFLELMNIELIHNMADSYSNIKEMQLLEITKTQLPHLLKYEDKNSMHFSIETRLPFLDYKLVELSLSLNDKYKIRNGFSKYILRDAASNLLPGQITWRKNKIGFEAPTNVWLKDEKFMYEAISRSKLISNIVSKLPTHSLDKILLWRLYNVAKWEEVFNVREN